MKAVIVIFGIFLTGCFLAGQQKSDEAEKDREFFLLIEKSKQIQEANKIAIQAADKKTSEIITKTANQIVSLKAEVKQLKSELNEANKKLDSVDAPISNVKFDLLPVSSGKENW